MIRAMRAPRELASTGIRSMKIRTMMRAKFGLCASTSLKSSIAVRSVSAERPSRFAVWVKDVLEGLEHSFEDRDVERLLALEVVVERGLLDADLRGDALEVCPGVALGAELRLGDL
jgi:hypothetical protein